MLCVNLELRADNDTKESLCTHIAVVARELESTEEEMVIFRYTSQRSSLQTGAHSERELHGSGLSGLL